MDSVEGASAAPAARLWAGLVLSGLAGAAVSVQSFVNGQLGEVLDSALAAATVNNGTALLLVLAAAVLTGAVPRAWKRLRSGRSPWKVWWFLGGFAGATAVYVTAATAPLLGIAFLTVALVLGQLVGSLVSDGFGLGPTGPQRLTLRRLTGTLCALVAVGVGSVGAAGHEGQMRWWLVALAVGAGAVVAVQQAGNAQLIQLTREPLAMGVINFMVGASLLTAVLTLGSTGIAPLGAVPPWGWLGGALGAGIAVFGALAARAIGVLNLFLGMVAGQSLAAVLLDLLAPRPGHGVDLLTLIGVMLTCVAVLVANSHALRRRRI